MIINTFYENNYLQTKKSHIFLANNVKLRHLLDDTELDKILAEKTKSHTKKRLKSQWICFQAKYGSVLIRKELYEKLQVVFNLLFLNIMKFARIKIKNTFFKIKKLRIHFKE